MRIESRHIHTIFVITLSVQDFTLNWLLGALRGEEGGASGTVSAKATMV